MTDVSCHFCHLCQVLANKQKKKLGKKAMTEGSINSSKMHKNSYLKKCLLFGTKPRKSNK